MWVKGIRSWPMHEEYVSLLLCKVSYSYHKCRETHFNSRTITIEGFKIPAITGAEKHILLFYSI